jgi:hypothetical protein
LDHIEQILYFDDAHDFGWHPSLSISSFGTTVGATVFHKSLFGHRERFELKAKFGGRYTQFYEAHLEADRFAGSRLWFETLARYEADRGELFGGVGIVDNVSAAPDQDPRDTNRLTYFAQDRELGLLRLGHTAGQRGRYVKTGGTVIINNRNFERNRVGERPTEDVYDTALIEGFDDGVTTVEVQANLVLDYRATGGLDSRGGFLETFGGHVSRLSGAQYWHYGAEGSYTLNLYRNTRLLTLRTAVEAVEGSDGEVAFTDLPRLGGPDRLRGYEANRFRDRRAALGSIEYHYPIHKNVMGELFVDGGHVSDHFEDLYDLREWKVGYGAGVIVGSSDSITLRFEVADGDGLQFLLATDFARAFDAGNQQR